MPLPAHTQIRCDPLMLTSPNGHISVEISVDRSIEVSNELGVDEVALGDQDTAIGEGVGVRVWGKPLGTPGKLTRLGVGNVKKVSASGTFYPLIREVRRS